MFYCSCGGVLELEAVEVGSLMRPARSNPMNMPASAGVVPVLIESGSSSKYTPASFHTH